MPGGREEEWRFTPVSRLTSLLADEGGDAHLTWETQLPEGVTVTTTTIDDIG